MANVNVNIKLYDIKKCGYYKNRSASPVACDAVETFQQVYDWVKTLPLRQKSTYDVKDEENIHKAYFLDVLKSPSNDYYISLWNEVPTTDKNAVIAISGNAKSDEKKLNYEIKKFGHDFIPGYATYFWISPKENRFATIRFERSINGQAEFKALMQGFLNLNPNYSLTEKKNNDTEVLIYGYKYDDDSNSLAYPKFQTCSMKNAGPTEFIKSKIKQVKAISGRSVLIKNSTTSLSIYNKIYSLFSKTDKSSLPNDDFKISYEIPCNLSVKDFNEILANWEQKESELDDVGFKIGSDYYWLSHEIKKTDIDLSISKDNEELFSLNDIMKEIEANKEKILNECNKENSNSNN